jgi:hypothetical protein
MCSAFPLQPMPFQKLMDVGFGQEHIPHFRLNALTLLISENRGGDTIDYAKFVDDNTIVPCKDVCVEYVRIVCGEDCAAMRKCVWCVRREKGYLGKIIPMSDDCSHRIVRFNGSNMFGDFGRIERGQILRAFNPIQMILRHIPLNVLGKCGEKKRYQSFSFLLSTHLDFLARLTLRKDVFRLAIQVGEQHFLPMCPHILVHRREIGIGKDEQKVQLVDMFESTGKIDRCLWITQVSPKRNLLHRQMMADQESDTSEHVGVLKTLEYVGRHFHAYDLMVPDSLRFGDIVEEACEVENVLADERTEYLSEHRRSMYERFRIVNDPQRVFVSGVVVIHVVLEEGHHRFPFRNPAFEDSKIIHLMKTPSQSFRLMEQPPEKICFAG